MRPKAILFDLDDTLISPHQHRTVFWREAITQIWIEIHGAERALPHKLNAVVEAIDGSAHHFWSDPARHKAGRMDLSLARFRILSGGMGSDNRFSESVRWKISERCGDLMTASTTLYPDAIYTLETLKSEGIRLALITNGAGKPQRAKVERFELESHFQHIQIEGEAGVGKPEPEAYLRALDALQSRPNETWMVGDNLEWEVAAPQKLGIFAIWRCPHGIGKLPGNATVAPDRVVTRLSELLH
ncbi:MAG: phosphoglycolate phosphatase [Rhodospirillaceae bacterium]|nr:phosphoglycolate phosphatase [Rhodospirillaceae bacterium]